MEPDEIFVTVDEAARIKQVSEETIRRWIRQGKLNAQKTKGERGDQYAIPRIELHTGKEVITAQPQIPQVILDQINQAIIKPLENDIQQLKIEQEKSKNEILQQLQQTRQELNAHFKQQDARIAAATRKEEKPHTITENILFVAILGTMVFLVYAIWRLF